jgi:hypothetical protein
MRIRNIISQLALRHIPLMAYALRADRSSNSWSLLIWRDWFAQCG